MNVSINTKAGQEIFTEFIYNSRLTNYGMCNYDSRTRQNRNNSYVCQWCQKRLRYI